MFGEGRGACIISSELSKKSNCYKKSIYNQIKAKKLKESQFFFISKTKDTIMYYIAGFTYAKKFDTDKIPPLLVHRYQN